MSKSEYDFETHIYRRVSKGSYFYQVFFVCFFKSPVEEKTGDLV